MDSFIDALPALADAAGMIFQPIVLGYLVLGVVMGLCVGVFPGLGLNVGLYPRIHFWLLGRGLQDHPLKMAS